LVTKDMIGWTDTDDLMIYYYYYTYNIIYSKYRAKTTFSRNFILFFFEMNFCIEFKKTWHIVSVK